MRLRPIALSCALTGALGLPALPATPALAGNMALTGNAAFIGNTSFVGNAGTTGKAGDPSAPPAAASSPVSAEGSRPPVSVSAPVTDNPYGARVTITVTLGPTFSDRRVTLYATPAGEARRLVAAGNVNARGKWYPTYRLTRATEFTAVFAGDRYNAPNSASRTLRAYARVTSRLTGYYKTSAGDGGPVYHVFHGTGTLVLHVTVAPDKHGECLEPETQQFDPGSGWDADTRYGCDALDAQSHDTAPFALSRAVGDRYRIRGDYVRGAGDHANLSAAGPWLYFNVTK
jgi:hypothetical protein